MFAAHVVFDRAENFCDGRSSILFATVAGVSLGLLTGGSDPPPPGRTRRPARLDRDPRRDADADRDPAHEPPASAAAGDPRLLRARVPAAGPAALRSQGGARGRRRARGRPRTARSSRRCAPGVDPDTIPLCSRRSRSGWSTGPTRSLIWLAFPLFGLICARSGLERRRTQLIMIGGGRRSAAVAGYGAAAGSPASPPRRTPAPPPR